MNILLTLYCHFDNGKATSASCTNLLFSYRKTIKAWWWLFFKNTLMNFQLSKKPYKNTTLFTVLMLPVIYSSPCFLILTTGTPLIYFFNGLLIVKMTIWHHYYIAISWGIYSNSSWFQPLEAHLDDILLVKNGNMGPLLYWRCFQKFIYTLLNLDKKHKHFDDSLINFFGVRE